MNEKMTQTPQETNFENAEKQIVVKVLSNENKFYAIWIEKDELVMEIAYSKVEQKINTIEGTLGKNINKAHLSELEKIARCTEALDHVLWEHTHGNDLPEDKQKSIKPNKLR